MLLSGQFFKREYGGRNHMTQGVQEQVRALAAVESESHFVQVGWEMLGADLVPTSNDSALQERECGFDPVRGGISVNVNLGGVVHALVSTASMSRQVDCARIRWKIVGHDDFDILTNILLDVLRQRPLLRIFSVEEPQFAGPV